MTELGSSGNSGNGHSEDVCLPQGTMKRGATDQTDATDEIRIAPRAIELRTQRAGIFVTRDAPDGLTGHECAPGVQSTKIPAPGEWSRPCCGAIRICPLHSLHP